MGNGLWINLAAAHILNGQGQPLSVLDVYISQVFEVGLLYLAVLGPDDLATAVHAHGRVLATKLEVNWYKGERYITCTVCVSVHYSG